MSIHELPIPYDVLVGLTAECLSGYAGQGWVEFEIVDETPGSTKYRLWQYQLGELGELTINKLRADLSSVFFKGPLSYLSGLREPNPEELADIEVISNQEDNLQAQIALHRKIQEESKELYYRRKEHLMKVREVYFKKLSQENIWPEDYKFPTMTSEILGQAIIEQVFEGTSDELSKYIIDYIKVDAPGELELNSIPGKDNHYYIVEYESVAFTEAEKKVTTFVANRKGMLTIKHITKNPPRSKWVCSLFTDKCERWAYKLAQKIVDEGLGTKIKLGQQNNGDKNLTPHVPKRHVDFKRWKVIWKWIRGTWNSNPNLTYTKDWLDKMHPNYSCGIDTLRKITQAGDAGMLD